MPVMSIGVMCQINKKPVIIMSKLINASEGEVQHYMLPELRGRIVGMEENKVREKTTEELEEIKKQAYKTAYKKGKTEG